MPSLEEFRELITEAATLSNDTVYVDGLHLIDLPDTLDIAAIEFFDWLGLQELNLTNSQVENNRISNLLAAALRSEPDRLGLLRALSFWITDKTEPLIPISVLDSDTYENPLIEEAVLAIKVTQGKWRDNIIPSLARKAARFIGNRQVSNILLESSSLPPQVSWELLTELLVEIRKWLPSSEWRHDGDIVQRLNESIRRRTTKLGQTEVWIDLGMPQGLIEVVPRVRTRIDI